jgi:signal transduction histidine kinase
VDTKLRESEQHEQQLASVVSAINVMDNIGYVFSGIRHELGNPLNNIKTTVTVLQRKLDKYSIDTIREHLSWIALEVSRVEYLLHSLKSFSMFENPIEEDIDLPVFLDELEQLVQSDLHKRSILLRCELDADARRVRADPRALRQVMLNLVSNAMDALAQRVTPTIVIATARRSPKVALEVRDSGCGIQRQQMQYLFKPFYTTKHGGSGLGLSLVHKMLSQMNGSIEINSVPDEGTVVTILLPESVT